MNQNISAVVLTSQIIEEQMLGLVRYLENTARRKDLIQAIEQSNENRILENLKDMVQHHLLLQTGVITNTEGKTISVYPARSEIAAFDFTLTNWYQEVSEKNISYVSDLFQFQKNFFIATAAPIFNETGKSIGYLMGQTPTTLIKSIIADVDLGFPGEIFLLSKNGAIIANASDIKTSLGIGVFSDLSGNETIHLKIITDQSGKKYLLCMHTIPPLAWKLIVLQTIEEIWHPLHSTYKLVIPLIIFIFITTLIVGYLWGVMIYRAESEKEKTSKELIEHAKKLSKTKAELEQLEFFAYISTHDLQEPLHKILLFSRQIKDSGSINDQKAQQLINRIEDIGLDMLTMIRKIHDFARSAAAFNQIELVNLKGVINEILEKFSSLIKAANIQVIVGDLPSLHSDRYKINKILENILHNSFKFHSKERDPKTEISAEWIKQDLLQIQIADNGIGFDMKYAKNIFQPFTRIHSGMRYGLGLPTAKKLVLSLKGEISIESQIGQGTVITILLPSLTDQVIY